MSAWARPVLVAGVGSEYGGDDSAGLIAARRLRNLLGTSGALAGDVRVVEEPGHLASLVEHWKGAATAVIIDAAVAGSAPGTVIRCGGGALPADGACRFTSTHGFGVPDAIEMARHLGTLPPRVIVFGIEPSRTGAGDTVSEEVSRAIDEVVAEVLEGVKR